MQDVPLPVTRPGPRSSLNHVAAAASPAGPWSGAELTVLTNDRVARPSSDSLCAGKPRSRPQTHIRGESPPPPGTMTHG